MVSDNSHFNGQPIFRNQTKIQQVQVQNLPCCEMDVLKKKRDDWVLSFKNLLDEEQKDDDRASWGKLCIYKVPHYLNENDNKSYFPQTVSLGPYHHYQRGINSMQYHKRRAFNMVLKRWKRPIEMYINAMEELEGKARACYEGSTHHLNSNQFIEMLVLDGCFVLEVLLGTFEGFPEMGYAPNDPVFAMRGLMHSIQRDMVMLENQLPLFVLNRLLEINLDLQATNNKPGFVAFLTIQFFSPLMPMEEPLTKPWHSKLINWNGKFVDLPAEVDFPIHKGALHCLDVFRQSLLQSSLKPNKSLSRSGWRWFRKRPSKQSNLLMEQSRKIGVGDKRQQQLIHCVTELKEAGIRFKRRETDRFWDIQFENGYLEIPKLLIHDGTKSLFSNLIAFEQCHSNSSNHMKTYMIFMDNLINSSSDVSYLHHCGIVEHWLGSDAEVADLFNRLCREVVFHRKNSYLSELSDKVNAYYNRKWNTWKATLKHKYFSNPWAYFSFFAAVSLLILTFTQSFYAVYAYYYKPGS